MHPVPAAEIRSAHPLAGVDDRATMAGARVPGVHHLLRSAPHHPTKNPRSATPPAPATTFGRSLNSGQPLAGAMAGAPGSGGGVHYHMLLRSTPHAQNRLPGRGNPPAPAMLFLGSLSGAICSAQVAGRAAMGGARGSGVHRLRPASRTSPGMVASFSSSAQHNGHLQSSDLIRFGILLTVGIVILTLTGLYLGAAYMKKSLVEEAEVFSDNFIERGLKEAKILGLDLIKVGKQEAEMFGERMLKMGEERAEATADRITEKTKASLTSIARFLKFRER